VLFRGNAEGRIRKQLIENNLIDAVISLPENLFLNTCIPVNVIVFSKNKQTRDILFISAEKFFEKHGKQNVMTDEHIQ
ncbi:N-6 DNA methylase, partial [Ruminococcus sp. CAG:57]|uniref:N-6 DNA methylase n=1 Tax=Ruminococcus sp. CAG:57 TaxID=1262962 RepID=UPI0034E97FEF